jgi:hypothetical protein
MKINHRQEQMDRQEGKDLARRLTGVKQEGDRQVYGEMLAELRVVLETQNVPSREIEETLAGWISEINRAYEAKRETASALRNAFMRVLNEEIEQSIQAPASPDSILTTVEQKEQERRQKQRDYEDSAAWAIDDQNKQVRKKVGGLMNSTGKSNRAPAHRVVKRW